MALLANRVKSNTATIALARLCLPLLRQGLLLIFITLSIYLLSYSSNSKKLSEITLEITGALISRIFVIYDVVLKNISYIDKNFAHLKNLEAENNALKLEVARLRAERMDNRLISFENSQLKKILAVVEGMDYSYITCKLLSVSLNPFSKTALISAGSKNGIKLDQIVISENGLIGRIIEVTQNYSKILLVSDVNSRIPIVTELSRERGILSGNGNRTNIDYLQKTHKVQKGEMIFTSGDGKIYLPNIKVAKVKNVGEEVIVEPSVNLSNTDYVSVIVQDVDNVK